MSFGKTPSQWQRIKVLSADPFHNMGRKADLLTERESMCAVNVRRCAETWGDTRLGSATSPSSSRGESESESRGNSLARLKMAVGSEQMRHSERSLDSRYERKGGVSVFGLHSKTP